MTIHEKFLRGPVISVGGLATGALRSDGGDGKGPVVAALASSAWWPTVDQRRKRGWRADLTAGRSARRAWR